ncbi:dynein light chain Tctex-type 5-like [Argiope bruennichi]|uniref:Tctex1 domain-containing protein 1 n=1 Tax=Argiope bruennichi TaxID=94029 RepID=A0A8T0FC51_ARGBR|nr:dynein light chain Tctex-type 5-like [Argiope bruennichi]KAF8786513.1 Tctex1 domain-containing protein 1 [Argiope bruennichi]
MSEENAPVPTDLDDALENGGLFFVTQILPVEAEDDLRPAAGDVDTDIEDEARVEQEEDLSTYQLEPTVTVKPGNIKSLAERALAEYFRDREYSATEMRDAVLQISSDIREEVRNLLLDRYRIVCQVTVGENCDQDVAMAFLCLWKHEFDHYAVATYNGTDFFATALVFVVYKQ